MRITIEPSTKDYHAPKVVLDTQFDDDGAEEAVDFVKRALVAYGFHWNNIFGEDELTLSGNRTQTKGKVQCQE